MQLEHRLSALLQLHLHSQLNTWLQWTWQRQLQDETRNIYVLGSGASYIRELTVSLATKILSMLWIMKSQCGKFFHVMTSSCNWWLTPNTPGNLGQGFLTLISPPFTNMSSGHQRNQYVQSAWKSQAAHQGEVMDPWSYLYIYMVCKSWFTTESDLQA